LPSLPQLGVECSQRALGEFIGGAAHLLLDPTTQLIGLNWDHCVKRDFGLRAATAGATISLHFDPPNQDDRCMPNLFAVPHVIFSGTWKPRKPKKRPRSHVMLKFRVGKPAGVAHASRPPATGEPRLRAPGRARGFRSWSLAAERGSTPNWILTAPASLRAHRLSNCGVDGQALVGSKGRGKVIRIR
jgi:hypothetical protein